MPEVRVRIKCNYLTLNSQMCVILGFKAHTESHKQLISIKRSVFCRLLEFWMRRRDPTGQYSSCQIIITRGSGDAVFIALIVSDDFSCALS